MLPIFPRFLRRRFRLTGRALILFFVVVRIILLNINNTIAGLFKRSRTHMAHKLPGGLRGRLVHSRMMRWE